MFVVLSLNCEEREVTAREMFEWQCEFSRQEMVARMLVPALCKKSELT